MRRETEGLLIDLARRRAPKGKCVACACTELRACVSGSGTCYWVIREPFLLCSACFFAYTKKNGAGELVSVFKAVFAAGRKAR